MRKTEKVMLIVFLVISVICGKFLLDYWKDSYDNRQNYLQVEEIVETFPDFRYYPPKNLNVHYYPDKMTAEELLEKLKAYQPEISETAVSVVRIDFCEDKEMDISGYQKLGSLDETTAKMDAELASKVDPKTGIPEKTVQMYFTIYYPDRDQMQELKGKINI